MESQIGKYEIVETLGKGAMGVVVKGYDRRLDRYVAVKTMFGHLTEDQEAYQRFLKEAQALAKLRHPNIVVIHELDEDRGTPYIVMEFLEGQDLKRTLAEAGRLPLDRTAEILAQAAAGLECAHRHGIIHRDVKPANLFITREGQVKIVDFGVARLLQSRQQTRSGVAVGTVTYMSPEQARGERVEAASDQFSLGVIAYELLRGDVPFKAETLTGVLMKIISDPPPPLPLEGPSCSPELAATVMRALEKSPERRFPTISGFADAYRAAVEMWGRGGSVATTVLLSGDTARVASQQRTVYARGPQPATGPPTHFPPGPPADPRASTRTQAIPPVPPHGAWGTPPPYPPGTSPAQPGFPRPAGVGAAPGAPTRPVPGYGPPSATGRLPGRTASPRRVWPWAAGLALFLAVAAAVVIFVVRPFGDSSGDTAGSAKPLGALTQPPGPGPGVVVQPGGGAPATGPSSVTPGGESETGSEKPPGGIGGTLPGQGVEVSGGDSLDPVEILFNTLVQHRPAVAPGTQAILVLSDDPNSPRGQLRLMEKRGDIWRQADSFPAGIGKAGFAPPGRKREGDQRVPTGAFKVGPAFGYGPRAGIRVDYITVTDQDYWVVDPDSPRYNRPVRTPARFDPKRMEKLRRPDSQYALALVIQYNMNPARRGLGSAIFLCLPPRGDELVSGCVTLSRPALERLLGWLDPGREPRIIMGPESFLEKIMAAAESPQNDPTGVR